MEIKKTEIDLDLHVDRRLANASHIGTFFTGRFYIDLSICHTLNLIGHYQCLSRRELDVQNLDVLI